MYFFWHFFYSSTVLVGLGFFSVKALPSHSFRCGLCAVSLNASHQRVQKQLLKLPCLIMKVT